MRRNRAVKRESTIVERLKYTAAHKNISATIRSFYHLILPFCDQIYIRHYTQFPVVSTPVVDVKP